MESDHARVTSSSFLAGTSGRLRSFECYASLQGTKRAGPWVTMVLLAVTVRTELHGPEKQRSRTRLVHYVKLCDLHPPLLDFLNNFSVH